MVDVNVTHADPFFSPSSAAKHYLSLGLVPVPVAAYPENSRTSWRSRLHWTPEEIEQKFGSVENVGLALGARFGSLIDLDFIWWEAAEMSFDLLGGLPIFGRESSQIGHRLVRGELPENAVQFKIPDNAGHLFGDDDLVVLELKGYGHVAMVAPSVHPSGEMIKWWPDCCAPEEADDIPYVDVEQLMENAGLFAALAVITRAYAKAPNNRDEICTVIASILLDLGFELIDTDDFVVKVAVNSGDQNWKTRFGYAKVALTRLDAGEEIDSVSVLCELLGIEPMTDTLRRWLGIGGYANGGSAGNAASVHKRSAGDGHYE